MTKTKYNKEMLMKFGIKKCAPIRTSMATWCKLSKDDESPYKNQIVYMSMINNLLYFIRNDSNSMTYIDVDLVGSEMTRKLQVEDHYFLKNVYYHGLERNKHQSLSS